MKKVIIIGGGFAGSRAAKKLENNFDVTLFDTKSYFEFTPGILRAIIESKHFSKLRINHKDHLKKTKIIIAKVSKVEEDYVIANNKKHAYDYLLICSGSSYSLPIKKHDAIIAAKGGDLASAKNKLEKSKNILIIGGGLVGIELASEICTNYNNKNITIVHSRDTLVNRNNKKTRSYITNFLMGNGVRVMFEEKIIKKNKNMFVTNKGKEIKTDLAFVCAGITPNSSFMNKIYLNRKDHIKVNEHMQVKNNIFAVGDVNDVSIEKTAQNAIKQTDVAIENIFAIENREKLQRYIPKKTPLCISLGNWNGVLETDSFTITGIIPGTLKHIIELIEMFNMRYL